MAAGRAEAPGGHHVTEQTAYVIVGVVTSFLLFAGAWVTARASRKATDGTTAVEGFDKLTGRLETRLAEVERGQAATEQRLNDTTRVLYVAIGHVQELLDFIGRHLPGSPDLPPMPDELAQRLPGTRRPAGSG